MEIIIKNELENGNTTLKIFPFDFILLDRLLAKVPEAKINNIHAILFSDSEDDSDDIYIKNDNISEVIGEIDLVSDIVNFFRGQGRDYAINKLDMDCGDINVFFDDDALLIISFPVGRINMNLDIARKVFDSLIGL